MDKTMCQNDNMTAQNGIDTAALHQPGKGGKGDVVDGETVNLLTEVGFLAIRRNRFAEASCIFETLAKFRPDADFPVLGLALVDLSQGLHDVAIARLSEALLKHPESMDLQSFLCLALFIAGHYEAVAQRVKHLEERTSDAEALRLLHTLGEEAEKHRSPLELCHQVFERTKKVLS